MKSEYTANRYMGVIRENTCWDELRRIEADISRTCEPGYDPYNSADRFRFPPIVDLSAPPLGTGPLPPQSE